MAQVTIGSVVNKIAELGSLAEELERIHAGIVRLSKDKNLKYDVEIGERGGCDIGLHTTLLEASKNLKGMKSLLESELAETTIDLKSAYWS